MDLNATRRPRLAKGRRRPVTLHLSEPTHAALKRIAGGNRSAAVEELVRLYRAGALSAPNTP